MQFETVIYIYIEYGKNAMLIDSSDFVQGIGYKNFWGV